MTNKVIIVDINIIVGIYDEKDVWHEPAEALMKKFEETSLDLIILDCVVNETFTALTRRLRERKSQAILIPTLGLIGKPINVYF